MKSTARQLCAAALATLCLGAAHAQDAPAKPSGPPQAFQDADKNHDGKLDEEEFRTYTGAHEAHGATSEQPGEGMPATEHQAQVLRNFKSEDLNGDGYISPDELGQTR